jgi:predicted ATP-binding protein involved in virulence
MANTEHKHFIKSFEIKNFRGIIDSGQVVIPEDTQWIFLTGENGFGKTSVLQALAAGLYGKISVGLEEKETKKLDINIEINTIDKNKEKKIYKGYKGKLSFKNLICYGTSRLQKSENSSKRSSPTYTLFNDDGFVLDFEKLLIMLYFRKKESVWENVFEKVIAKIKEILPELIDIKVEGTDLLGVVKYKEKFSNDYFTFKELATGWRSILNIMGDILKRSFREENEKNYDTQKIQTIILIDELDAHLHPKWQRRLPQILTTVFPNVQFVVSTHSPIPLLGAPKNSAFLKVTRNSEEGIKIENLDYVEVRNLTPNTILTSPIFDFEDFIPENDNDFLNLSVEDLYKDEVFYQILDKKLEKLSKEDENLLDELLK